MRKTAAALALASSRAPDAFESLRAAWEREIAPAPKRMLPQAIGLMRHESAQAFLISLVESAGTPIATESIAALATYKSDEKLRARVVQALQKRDDLAIRQEFEKLFA